MLSNSKWLAKINGNRWIVAKISGNKEKLTIHRLAELDSLVITPARDTSGTESEDTSTIGEEGGNKTEPAAETNKEAEFLRDWLKKNKIPIKKLQIALSCPGVITRMVTLPMLADKDLEKLLTEQVDQYFTLNIADYVVDYRILEKVKEDEQERLRVLLVAIPLTEWEKQWKLWEDIGFSPKVVDFSADCLCRLYHQLDRWEGKGEIPNLDYAIVDLGKVRAEFVLLEQGKFFLYSDMEIGLDDLTETEGQADDTFQNELEDRLYPVFNTLNEFLYFFSSRHYGKSVDEIFITGDCADLPHLVELFERNMGIPTKVSFPREWKPVFGKAARKYGECWMKYGSLYGLALREG